MRFFAARTVRPALTQIWIIALLAGTLAGATASAAQAAGEEFGLVPGHFQAGACDNSPLEGACTAPATQAGSHPVFSIAAFRLKTIEEKGEIPVGLVKRIRVDSPPGLITNPHAIPICTDEQLEKEKGKEENECPLGSQMGFDVLEIFNPIAKKHETLKFNLYNMVPPPGAPADFAYFVPLTHEIVNLVGGVSWYKEESVKGGVPTGDSHEYYTISKIAAPLISSTVIFLSAPNSTFLTVPTSCPGPATNYLEVESSEGQIKNEKFTPVPPFTPVPLETERCDLVPFAPTLALEPETKQSDTPTGATVEIKVPQSQAPAGLASAHLKTAQVTLPEGMTLNPAAANELEGCTPEQIGIGTNSKIACPAKSNIGTAVVESPAILPPEGASAGAEGSLTGNIYLGKPSPSEAITKPPYTIYVAVESSRYNLGLRLRGTVEPNPTTGQLTARFEENPQEPFSALKLTFKGGALAPLANPLSCGPASATASLTPWSVSSATALTSTPFTVDSNNAGGACAAPLPLALKQSTSNQSAIAGALTSFTFSLERSDGQQYLSQVKAVLPAGLLGPIPSVTLCEEAQANAGSCPAASQIGNAAVKAGAGPTPFLFTGGRVYLTGPYNGAPYGLSIVLPTEAGPFNLGNVVTRAAINVETYSGRLVVTSTLPRIVGGIPLRLQALVLAINRQSFLSNPTNCAALATESTLTGFIALGSSAAGATQSLSTPFQVGECSKLAFKPSFGASTGAKTSKANGASLEVKMTQGAKQANIRQVVFTLPKQLPSRLTTLQKACPAATFEVASPPGACPSTSRVGGVTASTPVLPGKLTGPAYLVSHGGQAFPDLDLILRGDGVEVVLVGHTHISSKGITTSTFESLPDVPITSVTVNLPIGSRSVLTANGNLCTSTLTAPTTIIAQSGTKITQKTKITVTNCPVQIVHHRSSGTRALVTVQAPAAGRISGSGTDLQFVARHIGKAGRYTISVPLTRMGAEVLSKFRQLRLRLRAGFVPKSGRNTSKAYATITFRS